MNNNLSNLLIPFCIWETIHISVKINTLNSSMEKFNRKSENERIFQFLPVQNNDTNESFNIRGQLPHKIE